MRQEWEPEVRKASAAGAIPAEDVAPAAAEAKRILIERTWPLIRDLVRANLEYMLYPPQGR